MDKFEPPDIHFYSAAVGWLELGNVAEAKVELAQLRAAVQNHPAVLELRWLIYAEEKHWEQGLQVAEALIQAAPKSAAGWLHRAYALRRVPGGGLQKAWEALLPAAEKFPEEPIIAFNLSCYACQMQQLDTSLFWLKRALVTGGKERMRHMALQDPDLQPLWKEIEGL